MKKQIQKQDAGWGGVRSGAGRKPEGKKQYSVTLTAKNVTAARKKEKNFSGLLDRLLKDWLTVQ